MSKSYNLIDIGINLCHDSFDADRNTVLERAELAGINHLVITGSCESSSQSALMLAQTNPAYLSATAGIHPHHAKNVGSETISLLKKLLEDPLVKAVGETGLDYYRNFSEPRVQEKVFLEHIELAIANQKPLFLHQRDAHKRFYSILKSYRGEISQAVVHCFTDSQDALFEYLDLDVHIGITGWICDYKRGNHLRPIIKNIPLNRLMLETDGPYLLPKSIKPKPKSRRNEPSYLTHIASQAANYYGCSLETLASETSATAARFFSINQA